MCRLRMGYRLDGGGLAVVVSERGGKGDETTTDLDQI
jgi:hypothetical protein